ncbi:hypothetical protein BC826DRAFT_917145, partial [Russula brevipes]
SAPRLVARTSTTPWEAPTGPEAHPMPKELGGVGNHPIKDAWEDNVCREVGSLLVSKKVECTSTDIVRIRYAGVWGAPVILWLGVTPGSLSWEDGIVVAQECRKLLEKYDVTDVDVEIRECNIIL